MNLTISHLLLRKSLKASPFITASASLFSIKVQNSKNSHFLSPFYFSNFPLYQTTISHSLFTKFLSSVIIDQSGTKWKHFHETTQHTFPKQTSALFEFTIFKDCRNTQIKQFANSGGALHIEAEVRVNANDNTFFNCTCTNNDCGAVSCKCLTFNFYYNCASNCSAHAVHTFYLRKYMGTNVLKSSPIFRYNAFTQTNHPGHALLLLQADYLHASDLNISQNDLQGKHCAGIQLNHIYAMKTNSLTPVDRSAFTSQGKSIYPFYLNHSMILNNEGSSIIGYFSYSLCTFTLTRTYFVNNNPVDHQPYIYYLTTESEPLCKMDLDKNNFISDTTQDLYITAYKIGAGNPTAATVVLSQGFFQNIRDIFVNNVNKTDKISFDSKTITFTSDSSRKDIGPDLCFGTYFFTLSNQFTSSKTLNPPTTIFTPSNQPQNGLKNLFSLLKRNKINSAAYEYSDEYDD